MNQHNAAKFRSQTLATTLLLEKNGDLKEAKETPVLTPGLGEKKPPNEQIWSQTGHGGAALREDARKGFRWDIRVEDGEGREDVSELADRHPFPSQLMFPLLFPYSWHIYFGNTSLVCN